MGRAVRHVCPDQDNMSELESGSRSSAGRAFEDFTVGMVLRHSIGRTVTAADNAWTTLLAVNTNPIHFDAYYAAQTEFGRPLVNSPFVLALVTGLSVADISRHAVNLGWDEVRLPAPVFEGDTIYAQTEVLSARESKSRHMHFQEEEYGNHSRMQCSPPVELRCR